MQGRLKLTSPGALLILAICLTGVILLLDSFVLNPYVSAQRDSTLRDQARRIEQAAGAMIATHESHLQDLASAIGRQHALNEQVGAEAITDLASGILENTHARYAWVQTSDGVASSWVHPQGDTSIASEFHEASSRAMKDTGLMKIGSYPAIFARKVLTLPQGEGYLYIASPLNSMVLDVVGDSVGARISLLDAGAIPPGKATWGDGNDRLMFAWVATDTSGQSLGYFKAEIEASRIYAQAGAARRIVLIILSLSVGLVMLVIMGIHILIAGPVVRLLKRLQQLENGEKSSAPLTRDLHGEPLVIARRLESAFERLAIMSKTDQLTGLANRRHFSEVLNCFYHQSRRYNRPMSVIMLDLDYFKVINDSAGHQAGDEAIRFFANCIENACRKADLPARFGGDEFAILLPETCSADAMQVAKRILRSVSDQPFAYGEMNFTLTASIGVADLNAGMIDNPEMMVSLADQALYAAKETGRNRAVLADEASGETSSNDGRKVEMVCRKLAGLDTQFKKMFLHAIEDVVEVLEQRDPNMAEHASKVQRYACLIATEMGLPERVVQRIEVAAMLHDIGMLAMPDSLLLKPGPLNEEQTKRMRRHPLLSVRMMEGMEFLEQEIPAVRYHHERFDGKGYPEGLSGERIPLTARVLTVADVFDALTSKRTYRQPISCRQALDEISRMSGTQFDPNVVDALVAAAARIGKEFTDFPPRREPSGWRHDDSAQDTPTATSGDSPVTD